MMSLSLIHIFCHSDIHQVHSDWKEETYPIVPGHEIVGEVVKVGSAVSKFKVGDIAGAVSYTHLKREIYTATLHSVPTAIFILVL